MAMETMMMSGIERTLERSKDMFWLEAGCSVARVDQCEQAHREV